MVVQKVIAENFYSIGRVEFTIENGVYIIYGENRDVASEHSVVSNGAGKTTIFNAIFQGLFNKNLKDAKGTVNTVNNLYTKKPYRIQIWFLKNGKQYYIDNDRSKNRITILEDGDDISPKGISNQLTLIKNIIGLDAGTFMSLTFLNQASLENIVDITSKDNIVYQFFNIDRLKEIEKYVKTLAKEAKEQRFVLLAKKDSLEKSLAMSESLPSFDISSIKDNIATIKESLFELENSALAKGIKALEQKVYNAKDSFKDAKREYDTIKDKIETYVDLKSKLDSGTCPVCGSEVLDKVSEIDSLINELESVRKDKLEEVRGLKKAYEDISEKLSKAQQNYDNRKAELMAKLNKLTTKLMSVESTKRDYEELLNNLEAIKEELSEINEELVELDKYIDFYSEVIKIIKSGAITETYLKKYVKLLTVNINEIIKQSSFTFRVLVDVAKGKITYKFVDAGEIKTFGQLSSGERTRVSMAILMATLKTVESLSGVSINFIVFDELLGVLDEDGVEFMKGIIDSYRRNKAIFIITHHEEVPLEYGDFKVDVVKQDNITTMEVTNV